MCPTYDGQAGTVGYTKEIDTYVYLQFTDTGEAWRLATFDELYNTVDNGGLFPWDDNTPHPDNLILGVKSSAIKTAASFAALASATLLYI